jgi:A/G-specific adenine glycosylase
MEANVKRVLHRLHARAEMSEAELWQAAYELLNPDDPFTHNQAMMDIGAMICTIKQPECSLCPLSAQCLGKMSPEDYPQKKQKKSIAERHYIIVIPKDSAGRLYLSPRNTRFLGGLYHFPEYRYDDALPEAVLFENSVLALDDMNYLGSIAHAYSHFKLLAKAYLLQLDEQKYGQHWHSPNAVTGLSISRTEVKALALLKSHEAFTV